MNAIFYLESCKIVDHDADNNDTYETKIPLDLVCGSHVIFIHQHNECADAQFAIACLPSRHPSR